MGGINKDSLPGSITQLQFGAQLNSMADTRKDSSGYILSSREREIQRNTQTVKSNELGCCLESKTYDKEGRNGSMHNSRKMSHCQCNGNGLNYREALKNGSGEKLTLQKDGLVENMPQIREIDICPCPVEAAFASPIESSRKVPSSSFEFYVRSEEGINLYVDLNSSPSDWTKRFKNEVHICENVQINKCQSFHQDLGCGDGDKELERSFLCDISAGLIKDGHVHTRSSSSSKIKISDHMDLATLDQPEEGDRCIISSAILPCSMSINVSEQLKEDRSLKSFNLNSTAENQIISVAESCAKDGGMVVVHSDVIDPSHIKLVDSVINSISDGSLSPALEYENSNLGECQNSTLQNVCSLVDTAVVNPGCSVSGSVEMQSSEVASCLKDAPCSPPIDMLTQALETNEYGGRLRGRGKGYTVTNYFHSPKQSSQKKNKSKMNERITNLEIVVSGLLDFFQENGNIENISEFASTCGVNLHGDRAGHADDVSSQRTSSTF